MAERKTEDTEILVSAVSLAFLNDAIVKKRGGFPQEHERSHQVRRTRLLRPSAVQQHPDRTDTERRSLRPADSRCCQLRGRAYSNPS